VVMRHARDGRVVEVAARTRTISLGVTTRAPSPRPRPAASRAAECDSARDITSVTGPKEAQPRSRI
jgi:hypothetical protein